MQLIVYTQQTSPRVDYIFLTLLQAVGVSNFVINNNQEFYLRYNGPKLNYSLSAISGKEVWIAPASLLFEKDIRPHKIEVFEWNGNPVFYRTSGRDLPFDLFAASFYLISRYEEYMPHSLDEYGRYDYKNSIAFKQGFFTASHN